MLKNPVYVKLPFRNTSFGVSVTLEAKRGPAAIDSCVVPRDESLRTARYLSDNDDSPTAVRVMADRCFEVTMGNSAVNWKSRRSPVANVTMPSCGRESRA